MPKWGLSRSEYFFDEEKKIIAKGLASVKFMSSGIAEELYKLAHSKQYDHFVDILYDLGETSVDLRQLDILIKLDFFSEFGNQRELLRIADLFTEFFKKGQAKKLKKDKVNGSPLEDIVKKYSIGVTKAGTESKSYTLLDVHAILREAEELVLSLGLEDLSDILKVRNFTDVMGYVGYVSGKQEDRRKLYVMDIYPLKRKKDGKQFGYSIITKSIGSGIESRFTVFNKVYDKEPIRKDDIIYVKSWERDGQYFKMTGYEKLF